MMTHRRIVSGFLAVLACGIWAVEVSATPHLRADAGDAGAVDRAPQQPILAEASTQSEPAIAVDRLPHRGMRIGNNIAVSANMSQAVKAGRYGHRLIVPWAGNLEHVQFNITSNKTNETSKSAVAGNQSHGFPASWQLGYAISGADEAWQPTGPLLRDIHFTHERRSVDDGRSRRLHQLELDGLPVTSGQRLLLWTYNREDDPASDWPSVNFYANGGRPAFGLDPPRAYSRTYGDAPMHAISGGQSDDMNPFSRGDLGGIGIRYTDGREWGDVGFDASPVDDVYRMLLGEETRVRQPFSYPYYFAATHLEIAAYRPPDANPQGDLTVRLDGADTAPITLTIPADSVQVFDGALSSSYTHDTQVFALPSPLLGAPDVTYTIEIAASDSTKGHYRMHARRRWSESTEPASGVTPIEPDHFDQDAEVSFDSGSSWRDVGWSADNGRAMLPVALVIDGRISSTPLR